MYSKMPTEIFFCSSDCLLQGTKLLASNLKRAVFGPKMSNAVRPAVPRSSYSDNKSQGELYSNIVRDRRPMNMMNNVP